MNNNYESSPIKTVTKVTTSSDGMCECPICKWKFPAFLPFSVPPMPPRQNARCPHCASLERHRKLYILMEKLDWHKENMRVLHFAPESIFYKLFSSFTDIDYWPVDLDPEIKGVKKAVDITNITFDDDSFDLIMCTHVLEHVPDEKKALYELHRVLKPKTGIALLNVPICNEPTTLEKPEYNTPELRLKYYGQEDHVRLYGVDYPEHLRAAGFTVHLFENIDETDFRRYGLKRNERIYWSTKE